MTVLVFLVGQERYEYFVSQITSYMCTLYGLKPKSDLLCETWAAACQVFTCERRHRWPDGLQPGGTEQVGRAHGWMESATRSTVSSSLHSLVSAASSDSPASRLPPGVKKAVLPAVRACSMQHACPRTSSLTATARAWTGPGFCIDHANNKLGMPRSW